MQLTFCWEWWRISKLSGTILANVLLRLFEPWYWWPIHCRDKERCISSCSLLLSNLCCGELCTPWGSWAQSSCTHTPPPNRKVTTRAPKVPKVQQIIYNPKVAYNGLKVAYSGLKVAYSGLKVAYSGLKVAYSGLKVAYSGPERLHINLFEHHGFG